MKISPRTILMLILAVVVVIAASSLLEEMSANFTSPTLETIPVENRDLPELTLYDIDGNPTKFEELKGKPIILHFWASWDSVSTKELPVFQEAWEQLRQDAHIIMVNVTDGHKETLVTAENFLKSQNYTFQVYFDTTMNLTGAFGVLTLPSTFFLDSDGNLIAGITGILDADILRQGLDIVD